jgi:hypothetical protein
MFTLYLLYFTVAQNLQTIIMQQIQDLQKGKGVGGVGDPNKRAQGGGGYQQKGPPPPMPQHSPFGSPTGCPQGGNPNLVKNAQHTAHALTLLLASQMQGQNGGGSGNGSGGQLSPGNNHMNASNVLQNHQLLAALQAMSKNGNGGNGCGSNNDSFLSGIPGLGVGNNLLGLASPGGNGSSNGGNGLSPMSQLDNNGIGGFFPNHHQQHLHHGGGGGGSGLLSPGQGSNNGSNKDDQWSAFKAGNRNGPTYGSSNGMHKVSGILSIAVFSLSGSQEVFFNHGNNAINVK